MCDLTPLHASEHLHTQYMLIPRPANPCFFLRCCLLPVVCIVFLNAPHPQFERDPVKHGSPSHATEKHQPQLDLHFSHVTDDRMYDLRVPSRPTHHNVTLWLH